MGNYEKSKTKTLRVAGFAMRLAGASIEEIAKRFGLTHAYVKKISHTEKWATKIKEKNAAFLAQGVVPPSVPVIGGAELAGELEKLQAKHRTRILKLADRGLEALEASGNPGIEHLTSYSEKLDLLDKIARRNLDLDGQQMSQADKGWGLFFAMTRGEIEIEADGNCQRSQLPWTESVPAPAPAPAQAQAQERVPAPARARRSGGRGARA